MTSSRDLAKEVEKQGWRLDRTKGSHNVYVKNGAARPNCHPRRQERPAGSTSSATCAGKFDPAGKATIVTHRALQAVRPSLLFGTSRVRAGNDIVGAGPAGARGWTRTA